MLEGAGPGRTWPLNLQTPRGIFLLSPAPQEDGFAPSSCFAFSLPFHRLCPRTSWSRTERHRLRGTSHPALQP